MQRPKKGSTPKQYAYAQLKLTGGGRSKNEIARKAGFSPSVANNAKYKIETTEGYHNAMLALATESNNVLGAILAEYSARGLKDFSNKDLNGAVNAISSAWDRIEERRAPARNKTVEGNPLRRAVLQKVETQHIHITEAPASAPIQKPIDVEVDDDF